MSAQAPGPPPERPDPEAIRRRRTARRAEERRSRSRYRRRRLTALVLLAGAGVGAGALISSLGGDATDGRVKGRVAVPILMYHVISEPPASASLPELYVKESALQGDLSWLDDRGYTGVTLDDVYDTWFKGGSLPEKPVVVSFDDGYRSQYSDALPVLQKLGWPGVLNLLVDTLYQGELTVPEVKKMSDDGWEIDSHTISHADVTTLSGADLEREVAGSRRILQRRLGLPIDFFCYPAGAYDAEAIAAVKRAGYLAATTVKPGLARPDQLYDLRRIRVDNSDGVKGFIEKFKDTAG